MMGTLRFAPSYSLPNPQPLPINIIVNHDGHAALCPSYSSTDPQPSNLSLKAHLVGWAKECSDVPITNHLINKKEINRTL